MDQNDEYLQTAAFPHHLDLGRNVMRIIVSMRFATADLTLSTANVKDLALAVLATTPAPVEIEEERMIDVIDVGIAIFKN